MVKKAAQPHEKSFRTQLVITTVIGAVAGFLYPFGVGFTFTSLCGFGSIFLPGGLTAAMWTCALLGDRLAIGIFIAAHVAALIVGIRAKIRNFIYIAVFSMVSGLILITIKGPYLTSGHEAIDYYYAFLTVFIPYLFYFLLFRLRTRMISILVGIIVVIVLAVISIKVQPVIRDQENKEILLSNRAFYLPKTLTPPITFTGTVVNLKYNQVLLKFSSGMEGLLHTAHEKNLFSQDECTREYNYYGGSGGECTDLLTTPGGRSMYRFVSKGSHDKYRYYIKLPKIAMKLYNVPPDLTDEQIMSVIDSLVEVPYEEFTKAGTVIPLDVQR